VRWAGQTVALKSTDSLVDKVTMRCVSTAVACGIFVLCLSSNALAAGESGSFTSPTEGGYVKGGTVQFTATVADDDDGVSRAAVRHLGGSSVCDSEPANQSVAQGQLAGAATDNSRTFTCSIDASTLGDGIDTLELWVKDNNGGLFTQVQTINVTIDTVAPAGGSISPPSGTSTNTSPLITWTAGSDLHPGTLVLQREEVAATGAGCAAFSGNFTTITGNLLAGSSPYTDQVSKGHCYMYRGIDTDAAGNVTMLTSANVLRVPSDPVYKMQVWCPAAKCPAQNKLLRIFFNVANTVTGTIKDKQVKCVSRRTVTLYRKNAGAKSYVAIGADLSDRLGKIAVRTSFRVGAKYQLRMAAKYETRLVKQKKSKKKKKKKVLICKAAKSRIIIDGLQA
jgi:hypothetical protein